MQSIHDYAYARGSNEVTAAVALLCLERHTLRHVLKCKSKTAFHYDTQIVRSEIGFATGDT